MKHSATLICMCAGVATLLTPMALKPSVLVAFNASDSAPKGFYKVSTGRSLAVGDYVLARLPQSIAEFAETRGYLPRSVPVLKKIAAMKGQSVCLHHHTVLVDAVPVATVLEGDARGRPLASWNHCRRLLEGELFLLNTSNAASFDSRYFGPLDVSFVRGRAIPWRPSVGPTR